MAECSACGNKFSMTSPAQYCSYCGKVFCAGCLGPPPRGRRRDHVCRSCSRLLASDSEKDDAGAVYTRIDDLSTRKTAVKSAGVTACSNPDCGEELGFREAEICSICDNGFCGNCISFPGEFRRTDVICLSCRDEIESRIKIYDAGVPDGMEMVRDMGRLDSGRKRSPEATLFFLKWMAHERGANALMELEIRRDADGEKTSASASAVILVNAE